MANIVVYVELRAGQPTLPSLFALSEARRVASSLGATVYALVVAEELATLADGLPEPLGEAGADKVLLIGNRAAARLPVESLWEGLLANLMDRLRPALFVWPAGSVGLQLGPALAVRTGAAFLPRASLFVRTADSSGKAGLSVRRWSERHDGHWTVEVGASSAPVVVTLAAGRPVACPGARAAELDVLSASSEGPGGIEELSAVADPRARAELAGILAVLPRTERDKTASTLAAVTPHDTAVLSDPAAEALRDGCPRLVLLFAGRTLPLGVAELRIAPEAHVVLVGPRRATPPSPLIDRLWIAERGRALSLFAAALSARIPAPATDGSP